jgi:hypothetical protein
MQPTRVFRPVPAGSATISVTTSTAATALPQASEQYRLYNAGSGTVFFNFGASGVTAAVATGTPIPSGAVEVFTAAPNATHIATIGSAAATLYVTAGEGI